MYNPHDNTEPNKLVLFIRAIILAIIVFCFAFVILLLSHSVARAQFEPAPGITPKQHDHAQHHDFYKYWMQPRSPNTSCCNVRIESDGDVSGDCYATKAELRPSVQPLIRGQLVWWAWRKYGQKWELVNGEYQNTFKPHWIEIDDDIIVREKNPDVTGTDAHLCITDYASDFGALCFKEPVGVQ